MTWNKYKSIADIVVTYIGGSYTDAWRSIKKLTTEEIIDFDFQRYYRENRVYFIGDGTGLTGFIVVDPEPSANDLGRHDRLTFIDLDTVQNITFVFDNDIPENET